MARNALLTKKQRQWLQGEDVYERPDRQVRYAIKQRFVQGYKDASLLYESGELDEKEIEQLLSLFERLLNRD